MDEVRKESRLIVDASLFQDAAFVIGELLQLISENEKSRIVLEYDPGTKKMVVTKDTTRNEEDDPGRYVVIERDEYEILIDLWKKQVRVIDRLCDLFHRRPRRHHVIRGVVIAR